MNRIRTNRLNLSDPLLTTSNELSGVGFLTRSIHTRRLKMKTKNVSLVILFICFFVPPVYSAIIGGSVTKIDPPANTGGRRFQVR